MINGKSKQQTSRNWLCTLNNPKEDTRDFLEDLFKRTNARYVGGQLERGECGTPHIQFYVNFDSPQRRGKITKICPLIHCEQVRKDNGASTYCLKTDTRVEGPYEFGTLPLMRNEKADWDLIWGHAKKGQFESIPKDVLVRHYSSITRIAKDHLKPLNRDNIQAFWIYGESGCGKSTLAHEVAKEHFNGKFYPKSRTKWWDGYQGEKCIIMDDIDKYNVDLGGDLKDWSDRYPLLVQNKGGAVAAEWETFIVTSQYSIEDIWKKDPETIAALRRRFRVVSWNQYKDIEIEPPKITEKPEYSKEIINKFKI